MFFSMQLLLLFLNSTVIEIDRSIKPVAVVRPIAKLVYRLPANSAQSVRGCRLQAPTLKDFPHFATGSLLEF